MNGKDSSNSDPSKPCWEGVALGWRRDVPDSLRLRSRGGDSLLSRCQEDAGLVLQSEEEPASLSSVRSDSCLNSMEYWDYTVELECIQGQQDSNVTTEVDNDLIDKNKELDEVVRFQQDTIQDQAMRIEHLCRQTSLMKEMSDSRTKVYEQMEVAVNSLEETNTRLVEEAAADKHRIRMLVENVDSVEDRCMELQRCLEQVRDAAQEEMTREEVVEKEGDSEIRRKESVKQIQINRERKATEERELLMELSLSRMSDKMMLLEQENRESMGLVKELEEQVVTLMEENRHLREETKYGDEEDRFSVKEELEDEKVFSECDTASPCLMRSTNDELEKMSAEEEDPENIISECQEETQDELIARLDTQYRALIDKYEDLLELFNQTKDQQKQEQPAGYQMSLQEELISSDCKEVMMDMMDISHDLSLNISHDVLTIQINNHDEKDDEDKYCYEDFLKEKEMQIKNDKNNVAITSDDYRQSALESENYCDDEHGLMDHGDVNICGMPWSVEYTQTNHEEQKEELVKSDTKREVLDIIQNKPLDTHKYTHHDELSKRAANTQSDKNFLNENSFVINFPQNFKNHYSQYDITINDNFNTNALDDETAVDEHFSTEEDSSVSSGFSEEIVEFAKVDQDCQTDIALPVFNSPKLLKSVNKVENYHTIFSQMFALLKSENIP